jgi:hypothetical protein
LNARKLLFATESLLSCLKFKGLCFLVLFVIVFLLVVVVVFILVLILVLVLVLVFVVNFNQLSVTLSREWRL